MTLAKAAPTDWAKWFADVTGQPMETVREKLGMTAECGKINTERPPRLEPGTASPHHLMTPGRG